MAENSLQLPCLGRLFQLGMLYDCNSDQPISEITLWDLETLKKHKSCATKFTSHQEILDSDTLNEKYNYLDITGDFKLSCLAGLVKVSGSAGFLKDNVSSLKQVRVCFKYCSNSKYEELDIDQLKDIPCTHNTPATHVVTGISYGADVIFVFDYNLQKHEERQEIITFMKNIVENLPFMHVDTSGNIKCNLEALNKEKVDKIRCKLYTDMRLESNPTTLQDAIKAYRLLVEQSSAKNNLLPKKVWLHSLKILKKKAFHNHIEISASPIIAIQSVIENLNALELKTDDLKANDTTVTFIVFQKELNRYAACISQYKIGLLHEVGALLPLVRSGKKFESDLINSMQKYSNSIFSTTELDKWLDSKQKEINVLKGYLRGVEEVKHAFLTDQLDEVTSDLEYSYVVCFEFNVCGKHDEYLEQLYAFSQSRQLRSNQLKSKQPWYKNNTTRGKIKSELMKFKTFYEANKNAPGTKYLLTHNIEEEATEGATMCLYDEGLREIFTPPDKCAKPELIAKSHDSLQIKWDQPHHGEITNYTIYYNDNISSSWVKITTTNTNTMASITNLQPDTEYRFKVCANCKVGIGEESILSDVFKTKYHISNAVEEFKTHGKCVKVGNPSIFLIPSTLAHAYTSVNTKQDNNPYEQYLLTKTENITIAKYDIGQRKTFFTPGSEKVLMILGATGCGKTTLINSMVNYLFGTKFEDDFRLQLISEKTGKSQAHSQTRCITSYTIYKMEGFKLSYPLTIVDTPGYGDTEGIHRDKIITQQIHAFFSQSGEHGIDHLDGVGFVAQSALARLTQTQEYIFDSILSLFGKDVKQNIFIMVTFADAEEPPVMHAIRKAKIGYKTYYKFNNSAVFADKNCSGKNFSSLYWEMGYKSFEEFFTKFSCSKEVSLTCTRNVLDERKKLDATVFAIQRKIELGVAKLEELEQEKKVLYEHEAKINASKKFTYEIIMTKQRKLNLKPGTYVTNCVNCSFTCHYPCYILDDKEKFSCYAMENQYDKDTKCRVCTGHCHWSYHFNNGYRFELYEETETRTSDELKEKYQEGIEGRKTAQAMVDNIKRNINVTREDVKRKMKTVQSCLEKLDKIALRTNPLTEEDYIKMLIQSEEDQKRPGYLDRIKFYQEALQGAQIVSIAKGSTKQSIMGEKYKHLMRASK